MKNKKAMELWQLVGAMIITALLVLVVAWIIPKKIGEGAAEASNLLSSTKDSDMDGISNLYDKCICLQGERKNDGCPDDEQTSGESAMKREKVAQERIKKEGC